MSRVARAILTVLLASIVATSTGAPLAQGADGLATRTFTINHRPVDDVVALIQPHISERGSYAVQPRIRAVTVTDTPAVLGKLSAMIARFDLPPRGIQLVVQLMRAEEGAPSGTEPPARRRGLPPAVIQDLTKWGVVTPIGSASVTTAENESGSVSLGGTPDEYRVRFTAGGVSLPVGVVRLERFVLERSRRAPAGSGEADASFSPVMDLVLNLRDRQTTVLGATSSQDSKHAVFVSITATVMEP